MTTPKSTSITKAISINVPASKVWNVLTNPDQMKLWMSDSEIKIISDMDVGSPIIIHSNVNGRHEYKGEILQMDPQRVFKYTSWSKVSKLPDKPENYSIIAFRLTPADGKTTLSITHSNLIAVAAIEHSGFFWNIALEEIKKLCENLS
jgi:uncharacterized protein YndB with AHSA1/START domain